MERPQIVTMDEWQVARDALLEREKASTSALDALAAEPLLGGGAVVGAARLLPGVF